MSGLCADGILIYIALLLARKQKISSEKDLEVPEYTGSSHFLTTSPKKTRGECECLYDEREEQFILNM